MIKKEVAPASVEYINISEDSEPEEWKYYTEGNENIICQYQGHNPKYTEFILRIQKATHLKISSFLGLKKFAYRKLFLDTISAFTFVQPFLSTVKQVVAPPEYICKLKILMEPLRPKIRKINFIDEENTNVIMISNYIYFRFKTNNSIISIELKPKSGVTEPVGSVVQGIIKKYADFEEKFPELYTQLLEGKIPDSTFMQIQRLKNRKIDTIIEYDPDDLYSLEAERIKKVLKQFLENPQSFYRFECSDKAITSLSEENLDILIAFIVQTQVLKRIQDIQKISGESIFDVNETLQSLLQDKHSLKNAKSYIKMAFRRINMEQGDNNILANEGENIESWIKILKYLIYVSAKDCSVMISFADVSDLYECIEEILLEKNEFSMERMGKIFIAKIGIIDLDVKNIKSIEKKYYVDRIQFIEAFIAYYMDPHV